MQVNIKTCLVIWGVAARPLNHLSQVRKLYDDAMREKEDLKNDADTCKRRMVAAKTLIDGLRGEKIRWTEQSKEFKAQIERFATYTHIGVSLYHHCHVNGIIP